MIYLARFYSGLVFKERFSSFFIVLSLCPYHLIFFQLLNFLPGVAKLLQHGRRMFTDLRIKGVFTRLNFSFDFRELNRVIKGFYRTKFWMFNVDNHVTGEQLRV